MKYQSQFLTDLQITLHYQTLTSLYSRLKTRKKDLGQRTPKISLKGGPILRSYFFFYFLNPSKKPQQLPMPFPSRPLLQHKGRSSSQHKGRSSGKAQHAHYEKAFSEPPQKGKKNTIQAVLEPCTVLTQEFLLPTTSNISPPTPWFKLQLSQGHFTKMAIKRGNWPTKIKAQQINEKW